MQCFREGNKCVDNLARRGALLEQDFVVFIHPPLELELLVRLDSVGTLYDQFVSSSIEAF